MLRAPPEAAAGVVAPVRVVLAVLDGSYVWGDRKLVPATKEVARHDPPVLVEPHLIEHYPEWLASLGPFDPYWLDESQRGRRVASAPVGVMGDDSECARCFRLTRARAGSQFRRRS